jgi:RNA polymerase sigma-70 factor (ECF subfamily)
VDDATATDNSDIARRIGSGTDRDAEAMLVQRFAHRVRLFGLRHLRDDAAADDLVQQVLVLTIESLRAGRVREPERLESFILGSCRTIVRDLHRGESRRERLLGRYAPLVEIIVEPPAPLERERVRACIDKLPARERTVVVLTFYADRTGDEVAHELGMTPGNVRVVRHRAIERLQRCLGLDEAAS